jgi:hypothetical protein
MFCKRPDEKSLLNEPRFGIFPRMRNDDPIGMCLDWIALWRMISKN